MLILLTALVICFMAVIFVKETIIIIKNIDGKKEASKTSPKNVKQFVFTLLEQDTWRLVDFLLK